MFDVLGSNLKSNLLFLHLSVFFLMCHSCCPPQVCGLRPVERLTQPNTGGVMLSGFPRRGFSGCFAIFWTPKSTLKRCLPISHTPPQGGWVAGWVEPTTTGSEAASCHGRLLSCLRRGIWRFAVITVAGAGRSHASPARRLLLAVGESQPHPLPMGGNATTGALPSSNAA